MKTLELFAGTGSFSKVAKEKGHSIFRVELNPKFEAELHKDILDINIDDLPKDIDILWASPPCTTFSIASCGTHWNKDKTPKTKECERGIAIVKKTIEIILKLKPKYWIIENPRGLLRKQEFMQVLHRNTVTYCQYGDSRMKPTDLWCNFSNWKPRKMCKNGMFCHESAPRGSRTGTQGLKNNMYRSVVPKELCEEIIAYCTKEAKQK